MVGCTTALLYEYKPAFIIFSLIVLINISVCLLGAFFYYDKFSLLLYILMSLITLVSAALYWMGIYWLVAIATALLATGFMGALLIVLFVINRKLNDKLVNKIFMD
jgi:hypothetical protein